MSVTGVSSLGSSLATSGSSGTSGTSNPASASNLSAVGQSLLTTGRNPDVVPSTTSTSATGTTLTSYQAEYLTLQQQDTAELLYASFLSPEASLENTDAVLQQAAALLGTPGSPSTSLSTSSSSTSASSSSSGSSTSSSGATGSSSTSSSGTSATDPLSSLPSVSSILAASDAAAQSTLQAYANAPAGSSIIDYQA